VDGEIGPADEQQEARVSLDRAWRQDMMSQHTGQHMLSRALLDVAGGETVSARLGASVSTIDIGAPALDEEAIEAVERHVNAAIMEDRPILVHFPSPAELAAMKLRREPKVDANVRVVEIAGYDLSPCGGTHCARTGQVGPVVVAGVERYKGMTRVSFLAGARSLAEQRRHRRLLAELARSFSSAVGEVPANVQKLRAELKERVDQLGSTRGELVALVADALLAASPPAGETTRVVATRPDGDLALARSLASRLARRPDVVALVATRESPAGDHQVVIERGSGAVFDCGAWLKATAARHGGRGGGRADRAEGRLPAHLDWSAVCREG
jgi:alanyl-tRNA synthetase